MSQSNNRRKSMFANKLHQEIFLIVFFASLLPALITAVGLFYLIFNITAEQVGFPEAIAANIIPAAKRVILILFVTTPLVIMILLSIAYKITHKIVGPFDRIVRELGEISQGVRQGPIMLRSKDKFSPLVDKINEILKERNP